MGQRQSRSGLYLAKESFTPLGSSSSWLALLAFRKDDELRQVEPPAHVAEAVSAAKEEGEGAVLGANFFYMKNRRTKERGFVSKLAVARKNTLECQIWYFGKVGRRKAEQFLGLELNVHGSYLIRESESRRDAFVLSVKVYSEAKKVHEVKHFVIRHEDGLYFITKRQKFESLNSLVEACQANLIHGLGIKLTNVCQRPVPSATNLDGEQAISRLDLEFDSSELLSKGNFGEVYKGRWRGTVDVAIKKLIADNPDNNMADQVRHEFHQEAEILQALHHPHLVQVFGICCEKAPFLMVTEYLPLGDLRRYLLNSVKEGCPPDFDRLLSICENIASGMSALAALNIVHRDLAARNVMLDKWLQAKVGDFGLARQGAEYSNRKTKFPLRWTSPEASRKRTFTHKSDVWSFGIVIWEIFTLGDEPYPGLDARDVLKHLEQGYRLEMPRYTGTDESNMRAVYNIMLLCWERDPMRRPTFEALQSDFDDFETAMESRYNYCPEAYMREQQLNNEMQRSTRHKKNKKQRKETKDSGIESGSKSNNEESKSAKRKQKKAKKNKEVDEIK